MIYDWAGSSGARKVNLSGGHRSSTAVGRSVFLQQTRERREQRERRRQQQLAQLRIASSWRAYRVRQQQKQTCRDAFDQEEHLLQRQQQQQQQEVYRQQARRVAFSFDPFSGGETADAARLLAAAALLPPPAAAAPASAATAPAESPSCALHVAMLRALSLHYRNLLLLQHSAAANEKQQQQQKEPPLLLLEGDVRCCYGWRGSALSPAAKMRFGLPASRAAAAAAAAAAAPEASGSNPTIVGRLALALLPFDMRSPSGQQAAACAAATARLLLQLLRFDQQQQQQRRGLLEIALWRLLGLGACVAAQVGDFVRATVIAPAAERAAATGTAATPSAHEANAQADDALLLLQHLLSNEAFCADGMAQVELLLHIFGSPLLLPSFGFGGERQQQTVLLEDAFLLRLEALLLADSATIAAAPAAAAAAEAFPQLTRAADVVAAANAAGSMQRRLAFPRQRQQLSQQQQQQQQAGIGLQQKQHQVLPRRQQQLRRAAAEAERLDNFHEALRLPYTLGDPLTAAAATATATATVTAAIENPQMPLAVCAAGNLLSLFSLRWRRLSAAAAVAAKAAAAKAPAEAALACPLWLLASLRLCGWACPFDILRTSLLSAEEQRGLPLQQQQQQQVPSSAVSPDEALRRQLVILTEGWAVDAFFASAQAAPNRGLSDLLQLYFPPDAERASAASAAAAVQGETEEGYEEENVLDFESDDEEDSQDFNSPWENKYTDNERLILNALSVSTSLPLRLLNAVRAFLEHECSGCIDTFFVRMGHPPECDSEWGEAVRSLCIVLKYKLQMTDDSELLEETEEHLSPSSSSSSSSSFSLKRSDLRWLLLTLNRLAWLLLRSACAPAVSQQQQQQQQQQRTLLLPLPSSSSSRVRKGRERLWQLVPGVLRELLDLSGRVSLVSDEEKVLADGPSSLIVSAAAGQRLPALWECLVWCMRGGDAAAAAAVAGSTTAAGAAGVVAARGHVEPPPSLRLSNLPTRLLASSIVYLPHTIAFPDRLAVFYRLLAYERGDSAATYLHRRCFKIRRTHIVEDGLAALLNGDIMRGFQVEFITAEGTPEAGIDGGGLLKELIVELSRRAFDPAYGLFNSCDDNSLFPSPSVEFLHANFADLFLAIGKLVGKAVSEGVLIEPQLNRVFLKLLLRRPCRLDDIKSLDPSVHRSLMLLKKYPGDAADLSLTFSVMRSEFGGKEEVDLIPNGRNIPVTNGSKLRYVQLVSEFKCVRQIQRQTEAFLEGLAHALPLQWLQMFSAEELQHLISGTSEGFNVADLRCHASYSGGYTPSSPPILWLWELLAEMPDSERSCFLMFVTSCSRAPLRGFGCLSPPFTIHKVPDTSRLPTSSTCVNLFKLPAYATREELTAKVREALGGTSGFGLS